MTKQESIIKYQAIGCLLRMGYNALWSLDDLMQEGQICLDKAQKTWRPDGGARFNTYLTTLLINRFAKIVKKERGKNLISLEYETEDTRAIACLITSGQVKFRIPSDLSSDAELFLLLTFQPPPSLRDRIRASRGLMCNVIKRWLTWTDVRLRSVEQEIRAAI